MSLFIVCFLIKASLVMGIFHSHSNGYNIVNGLSHDKPTYLVFTKSMEKSSSFPLSEIHSTPLRNVLGNVFSPSPNAAKNTSSVHLGTTPTHISLSKRQRRRATFPPNRRTRRPPVTSSSDGKSFQAAMINRRQILADDHFQRSSGIASPEQNGRNIWQRVPGFRVNRGIPVQRRFRPFLESSPRPNRMRSNQGQRRSWRRFIPNHKPEISGINLNKKSVGRMNPEPEFSRTKPFPEPEKVVPNPEPGMVRPNPEPGRILPNPEPGRSIPNPEPGIVRPNPKPVRIRPNLESGRQEGETDQIIPKSNNRHSNLEPGTIGPNFKPIDIKGVPEPEGIPPGSTKPSFLNPDNRFSNGPQFPLKKNIQVPFPQINWSRMVPWPRQRRRQGHRQTPYPLFPWWQKRASAPSDTSDPQSNLEHTENQPGTEDEWNGARSNRGDVDVPDSCVALTPKGDCNFYRCFDQRHTCPVEQNFAYNVASYLCRRTENFLNFFDDKAKKYLRGVKRCQMEALVPTYELEVATCAQIEAVGLDILTGGILPPSVNDVSCFFQNNTFCDVIEDPQNVQLLYDLYGGQGYTEYRVFIHFVKLIQKCSSVALESFNERYARRFMTFDD